MDERVLKALEGVAEIKYHSPEPEFLNFTPEKSEPEIPNYQYRVSYTVHTLPGVEYNDLYKAVNTIKAVPYSFV